MDALAFLLISLPIFYPIVMAIGYDPIWFGQVICVTTCMGAIMPPIGICCYVVAGMAKDIPIGTVFRGGSYFLPTYIIADIIMILFPYGTVLVLSNLVR
jgi:TRAP-type C4-dicarboxylate transport system permease large subunit